MRRCSATGCANFACDPSGWHAEIDAWRDSYGEVVVDFPPSRARMIPACSRFYTAVTTGALTHDADARLARHLANAVVKETADGSYIVKERPSSPRRIDLAVASVIALDRAAWHHVNTAAPPLIAWSFV